MQEQGTFVCPVCGLEYGTPENLEEHGFAEHGETFLPTVRERVEEEDGASPPTSREESSPGPS